MNNFPYRVYARYTGYDYDTTPEPAWYILLADDLESKWHSKVLTKSGTRDEISLYDLEILEHPLNDAVIMEFIKNDNL